MNDLTGQRFNRLTPIKYVGKSKNGHSLWLCKCDCKKETVVQSDNLKNGHTQSCGCLMIEHGHCTKGKRSKTYRSWEDMIQRCTNLNNKYYKHYGGRGISVCKRWLRFENFLDDIVDIPIGLTIDRIDNNGNYEPNNWKLSTTEEQNRNKRNNINVLCNEKDICLKDYCKIKNLNYKTIIARINDYGWPIEKALITPIEFRRKRPLELHSYELQLRSALKNLKLTNKNRTGFSKHLPYNSQQLCGHIENVLKIQNNCCPMCDKSYNEIQFDIDHIIPTSTAKTRKELLKLFNLENLSILCGHCNRHIKRNKIITYN